MRRPEDAFVEEPGDERIYRVLAHRASGRPSSATAARAASTGRSPAATRDSTHSDAVTHLGQHTTPQPTDGQQRFRKTG
jgi:hypothetical protein